MSSSEEDAVQGEGSTTDDEEQIFPWWKACIIALPQMGVQVMWMVLGPNTTPYLKKLGATEAQATLNNSAGPIVGFFVGPLVGTWSDQSTSKWGRRRPIIVAGLVSTIIAALLYGGAEQIMGEGNGMFLAGAMQWVLDFTVNAMQTPFRALVADLVSPSQQRPMQVFFSVVCAVGGFLAFTIMGMYKIPIHHMFELMSIVLLINVVCVGAALSVATEKQYVRTGKAATSACGPLAGMSQGFQGMPKAFYLLMFISCMVWMGNTVWGSYGQVWFTRSVFEGDSEAAEGTPANDAYAEGAKAFNHAGQMGSAFQLPLALAFMGLSLTSIPSHLLYSPCVLVGGTVCLACAFFVGHSTVFATICFILSNVPLTAAGSFPYGIVAVWNKAAVAAGNAGSVAMQMAILNCCITVGQQLCTMILAGLENDPNTSVSDALKYLFIISAIAQFVVGILTLFLRRGQAPEKTTVTDGTESEGTSD